MKNKKTLASVLCLFLVFAMILPMSAMATNQEELTDNSEEAIAADAQNRSTYSARIMQGNTNEEDDCRATENGLLDSGSYTTSSIVETGWTYTNSTTSSINTVRANATNFLYSKLYSFAYFSGHGSRTSGIATLNVIPSNPSSASGTYTPFNVAETLGVDSSTWLTDSNWSSSDNLRVLMLAACYQLDSTIMHYYARAMRSSNVRAIAGYHESGPGHSTDVTIADNFFTYANAGNSVKYSWQYANTFGSVIYPWAVLVYTENYNEYYRIPGFPGNTYTDPSSQASVYRFRSGLTGSQIVNYSRSISENESLPRYATVTENNRSAALLSNREPISSSIDLPINSSITDSYVANVLARHSIDDLVCIQTPVYRDEINMEDGGSVSGSEVVVERIYHYYNTYNGIRIADASVVLGVDANGIYTVNNYWKDVTMPVSIADSECVNAYDLISERTALSSIPVISRDEFILLRSSIVYAPIASDSTTYTLAYELISTDGRLAYVDAVTGDLLQYEY